MQAGESGGDKTERPLARHERAHLALVGEMIVLPIGSWIRDALDDGDPRGIAAAEAALVEKLPFVNDVLAKLGRRTLDMDTLPAQPIDIRLRLAILHLATEVIAAR